MIYDETDLIFTHTVSYIYIYIYIDMKTSPHSSSSSREADLGLFPSANRILLVAYIQEWDIVVMSLSKIPAQYIYLVYLLCIFYVSQCRSSVTRSSRVYLKSLRWHSFSVSLCPSLALSLSLARFRCLSLSTPAVLSSSHDVICSEPSPWSNQRRVLSC